jgi:hypothetical protein
MRQIHSPARPLSAPRAPNGSKNARPNRFGQLAKNCPRGNAWGVLRTGSFSFFSQEFFVLRQKIKFGFFLVALDADF